MEHGAGGKWYLNAEHYSNEIVEKYDLREFLLEQYTNFEQISVRKVAGFSPVGMDHTFSMPVIGRLVKRMAERMLHSQKPPTNPFRPEGHIGQVIPMEDAIVILMEPYLKALDLPVPRMTIPYPIAYCLASVAELAAPRSTFNRFAVVQTCVDHTYRHDRAARDLGYRPLVSREEAFSRTLQDLRSH